jgi:hypothetical protein
MATFAGKTKEKQTNPVDNLLSSQTKNVNDSCYTQLLIAIIRTF